MAMYSWLCTNRPEMFWYSGLSRICVGGLAVRRVPVHQVVPRLLGVEHGRPQLAAGRDAGVVERRRGHLLLDVAEALRPRALASRLAGSTVSTSTLPPWRTAAIAADRRRRRRLAHPARPAGDGDLLGRQQLLDASWSSARCASVPQLRAQRVGHLAGGAQAVRAHEQVRHVQQRHRRSASPSRRRSRWPARVRRSVTASRAASSDGLDAAAQRGRQPAGHVQTARRPPPRRGRTARAAPGSRRRRPDRPFVSCSTRADSSMVSLTGISSGVATITRPVVAASARMSSSHPVC